MTNQTAYLTAEKQLEIKDSPMPVAGNDDVLVKLKHVVICESDVHIFNSPFDLCMDVKLPLVLGHKCAGEVIEYLCPVVNFMAAPPWKTGAFSKYITHPSRWCFKKNAH